MTRSPRTASTATAVTLHWTGNAEADALIGSDALALLIGFVLDQQVPIEWAFSGPLRVRERLGTLDAGELAKMQPARVTTAFATPPALHRFPVAMAERVQALCRIVADEYGGDAARIWREAPDAATLHRRLAALPGFGPMKVRTVMSVLAKRFGVRPDGWESEVPDHMTLGDVVDAESLAAYRAFKRERKAEQRAGAQGGAAARRPRR